MHVLNRLSHAGAAGSKSVIIGAAIFSLLTLLLLTADHSRLKPQFHTSHKQIDRLAQQQVLESFGKLPMTFEANQGQADADVKFMSRGNGYTLFLTANEAVLSLQKPADQKKLHPAGDQSPAFADQVPATNKKSPNKSADAKRAQLRIRLIGANPQPQVSGVHELPGKSNYFIGNDPGKWHTDICNYSQVKYRDVYPGVDLVYYGKQQQMEFDFIVAPGFNPGRIKFAVEGASRIDKDLRGDLILQTSCGDICVQRPRVYQQSHGINKEISGDYAMCDNQEICLRVSDYDLNEPLIIDPVLTYSYIPICAYSEVYGIAVDEQGNTYLAGRTTDGDFPTKNAVQPDMGSPLYLYEGDAFVTKLDASGTQIVYSTYLGGHDDDGARGIAVDSKGNAYITGFTQYFWHDPVFPLKNPLQQYGGGQSDAFVVKLNPEGNALAYSTYLGGGEDGIWGYGEDIGQDIAVDASGNAYITGSTDSEDNPATPENEAFPLKNPYQSKRRGPTDAFLAKINADGSALVYSTYLGGNEARNYAASTWAEGIAVDDLGNAFIAGHTSAYNFPVINAVQPACGGDGNGWPGDAFVSKFNPSGSGLIFSTYLGGASGEHAKDIALDQSGNAYICGWTMSDNFPNKNGLQTTFSGGTCDGFVTKLSTAGEMVYSTFLGGSGYDAWSGREWKGIQIAVDREGHAYVEGETQSTDFPVKDALQASKIENPTYNANDIFITKLDPSGQSLVFSTYLGGLGNDEPGGIAVDSQGSAYFTGIGSENFPQQPVRSSYIWGLFIAKIGVPQPLRQVGIYQEIKLASSAGFSTNKKDYVVTFDKHQADVIEVDTDSVLVRVPPDLIGDRSKADAWPDSSIREVTVVVKGVHAPGDTVLISQSQVIFHPPQRLLYDNVTRAEPPLMQGILQGKGRGFRQAFIFLGPNPQLADEQQGTVGVRIKNTRAIFPKPLKLLTLALSPPRPPVYPQGEFFSASTDGLLNPTEGNLINPGMQNAGMQFDVDLPGVYVVVVEASESSSGPFPAQFQIHIAGNAGLPRKVVNGIPQPPRATRLDILFNNPAPRPEILASNNLALGSFAETAAFKFANPLATSRFAIAVLVPPAGNPLGFPFGTAPVRSAPPARAGLLRSGNPPVIDPTVPTALSPDAVIPAPGTVVDYTQVPIPASPDAPGPMRDALYNILWTNDGVGVALPFPEVTNVTSLILDMGSGNEIVDGTAADLKVFALGSGTYSVAASNTPFADTFVPVGTGAGQLEFDLSGSGLTSARYIRIAAVAGIPVIDAVQSLHFFVDSIQPTAGPVADVGFAAITMRRQKAPVTPLDPFLELIGPDGSALGENESAFGDETSQDRSDAALTQVPLSQQGFYRFLARGYDDQPDEQSFGNFFTRLETAGNYDKEKIKISSRSEKETEAQKHGLINTTRQRDSFLFEAAPGTTVNIVVKGTGTNPLPDPVVELYDPEDFLIAANDNAQGRGRNAALTITLPATAVPLAPPINRQGGLPLPNPSTYRIVVMGTDGESGQQVLPNGVAHIRQVNGGSYELKVFTGEVADVRESAGAELPEEYVLRTCYPNPFNSQTVIEYELPAASEVELIVYNQQGQRLAILVNGRRDAGFHMADWNGCDVSGRPVASGIYFYRIKAGNFVAVRKTMLVR